MKLQLTVPSMVCSGCSDTVTQTIQALDANAKVQVDLTTKAVVIETQTSESEIRSAISAVGHEVQ